MKTLLYHIFCKIKYIVFKTNTNCFIAVSFIWKKQIENKIHFEIERIKSKTKNEDTFDVKFELDSLKNDLSNVRADKSKYGSKFVESKSRGKLHEVSRSRNTRPTFLHRQ